MIMKKNIAFLSLKPKFCTNVCKTFCDQVEMVFADVHKILQYNLVNQNMLKVAGKQYFEEQQQKIVKSVAECENIGLLVDLELLNVGSNLKCVADNCLIVYLQFSKRFYQTKNKTSFEQSNKLLHAFEQEDKICESLADITVSMDKGEKQECLKIIDKIKQYYG